MLRKSTTLLAAILCASALGCAMCAAPYDYTGPIPAEGLGFNDRAGSILGDLSYDPSYGNLVPESEAPTPPNPPLRDRLEPVPEPVPVRPAPPMRSTSNRPAPYGGAGGWRAR